MKYKNINTGKVQSRWKWIIECKKMAKGYSLPIDNISGLVIFNEKVEEGTLVPVEKFIPVEA